MTDDTRDTKQRFAGKPISPPEAPPLPPPPPTRLRDHQLPSKQLPSHLTDGTPLNNRAVRAAMAAKFAVAVDRANALPRDILQPDVPFKPCHIFFYGSLISPQVLQNVAELGDTLITQDGVVRGFQVKMWGMYPAAIPGSRRLDAVTGIVWYVDERSRLISLQEYEMEAYKLCDCEIEVEGDLKLPGSKIFCWAGDHDSPELEEGVFDFERYQKHFMPSVTSAGLQ